MSFSCRLSLQFWQEEEKTALLGSHALGQQTLFGTAVLETNTAVLESAFSRGMVGFALLLLFSVPRQIIFLWENLLSRFLLLCA
jgi:hypothetical protein